jgi:UDP-2,3-diacylglucosamine pyrophosphatase LpxH
MDRPFTGGDIPGAKGAATGQWDVEDFQVDDAFCAFLDHLRHAPRAVELIIAGDFIDYRRSARPVADITRQQPGRQRGRVGRAHARAAGPAPGSPAAAAIFAGLRDLMEDGRDRS